MELRDLRDRLLLATLPHVPFDGWSARAMRAGAADAGCDATMVGRAFPGGTVAMVEHFCDFADRAMMLELERRNVQELRHSRRLAAAVRVRLEQWGGEREAVRRAVTLLALPTNVGVAARCTWRTVDAMWWAAGDTATDFSFYTKRATLAAIYTATVLYWMEDRSDGFADTWAFLDRRIEDALRIPKMKGRLRETMDLLPNPFRAATGRRKPRFGVRGLS